MRFHFLDVLMNLRYRGANEIPCAARFSKGQELGWFEHGSTIILFAPAGFKVCQGIQTGEALRMGQALLHLPQALSKP
jgi:phosphatidylserine decarboxylase